MVRARSQNIVIYSVFVPFAWKRYILQHVENWVNTSVFARPWLRKTLQIQWFLLPEAENIVNTVVWGFRGAKKASVLMVFVALKVQKKT